MQRRTVVKITGIIIIILLLSVVPEGWAQESQSASLDKIRRFENFAGVVPAGFNGFTQDADGFFWFPTGGGFVQWDGRTSKFYSMANSGLKTADHDSLYVDREGILWSATHEGLSSYDKKTNTFNLYKSDPNDSTSISTNNAGVFTASDLIMEDDEGALWVGTQAGLNRLDKARKSFKRYLHDPAVPGSLINDQIGAVLVGRDGVVWAGTGGGLCRLNEENDTFTCYTHDPGNPQSLSNNTVTTLCEDHTGVLWVGTADGLNRFDAAKETFTVYRNDPQQPTSLASNMIRDMVEDDAGYLWLTHYAASVGVSVFDPRTGTATNYRTTTDPFSIGANDSMGVYKDRMGSIWVLFYSGTVSKYTPEGLPFVSFKKDPADPVSLKYAGVYGATEDLQGRIWILTNGPDGFMRFDRGTGTFTSHSFGSQTTIRHVGWSSDGILWGGDTTGTLYTLDLDKMELTKVVQITTGLTTRIRQDHFDPDILWVTTTVDGLVKYNRKSGEITKYKNIPGDSTSIGANQIWADLIQEQSEPDIIWVGTLGGGLDRFNKRTGKVELSYKHDDKDPTSLSNNAIVGLLKSAAGEYWALTVGGGLNKFDPATGKVTVYSQKNGRFPEDGAVYTFIDDQQGNLWIFNGLLGLIQFNPATETYKVYGKADGVTFGADYVVGRYRASNGELWCGGSKGVTFFDPAKIKDNEYKPPVYITSLTQGGELMQLLASPEKLKTITLSWEKPFFEFEAAALNYTKPEKNRYKYMLEGWDKEWFNAGLDKKGRYSGLRGGTYTLKVMGSNNDGVWSDKIAELKVIVTSPFYKTAWFYTLCGVVGFGVIGLIYRVQLQARTHRLKAEREAALHQAAEREKEAAQREKAAAELAKEAAEEKRQAAEAANRAKSTFLSNMSHELRTPLNGILGYAQILNRDRSLTTLQKDGLQIIYDSGSHLLTLINDILDLAKVEAGKLELAPAAFHLPNFLDSIAGIIRMRAEQKNILFKYQAATPLPDGVFGDEKRLRQVLLNLLGNAVKFTQEGSVTLRVSALSSRPATPEELAQMSASDPRTIDLLRFEVIDTGVGISSGDQQKLFKAFEQVGDMQTRAEGTGLGLAISRRLVEMMGGEIEVKSAAGQGSTFWFEIELPGAAVTLKTVQQRARELTGYKGRRLKVLVADDKLSNRLVLVHLLEPLGFVMELAENGRELVAKAPTFQPDIIFTDLVMPVMTGFEAAEQLRQIPELQQTPVIATSASVFEMDRQKSRVAGCNDFLSKPIVAAQLFDMLSTYLQVEWVYGATEAVEAPPSPVEEALVPPPIEERQAFYDLAMGGDMDDLLKYAARIEALGAQYRPFVRKLQDLAKDYQDAQILVLAEQYLEEAKLTGASADSEI